MTDDLAALLPQDKLDLHAVARVIERGYPAVEPLLPELLTWMQDLNWPVAQALRPFLASIGAPLAPHIRPIFETDDDVWKYWIGICVVAESKPLTLALKPQLEKVANGPTAGEQEERVDVLARNILQRLARGGSESVNPWVNDA
jgi:hypothetical protein